MFAAHRRVLVPALAAAALLVPGTAAAVAAPATAPSAAPGASPSTAPSAAPGAGNGARADARAARAARQNHVVCTRDSSGHLVNCPVHVPNQAKPRSARNTSRVAAPIDNLAGLVDTRTWTTGGGNTFPGAIAPWGEVQWSPDTLPNRSAGGGYSYGDTSTTGYSLTHVSGPGCGAGGDIPMLPMTGALPAGNPNDVTTAFSNDHEIAQAGYYSAESNQPDTITSEFTATPHSSMGRFSFPQTDQAGFLIKLHDSQNGEYAPSTANVVSNNEISGSETSGHFCGEDVNDGQKQEYTAHFDIVFDQPFTAKIINGSDGTPDAVYLVFDTTQNPVVQAKVGLSYVSDADAKLDWQQENPGWNFASIKATAQQDWNDLLGRMQISGGTYDRTQMFYSLLYKDFVEPNIVSDVNGEYMGADMQVHTVPSGQNDQYGMYSGWDIYHSLSQLQAMLDPKAASDQAQSQLNYYGQDKILQQWGYNNQNNYVMVGDPMQSIIADYYAFGARDFDTSTALADMVEQATTTNDVRPGQNLEDKYGYLPEDGSYRSCCNPHGYVSSLLEYDSNDLALSRFAAALGDKKTAAKLEKRANNWENTFYPQNNLLNPRNEDGTFVPDITPTTTDHYVEGDAYEYLWNVPNNYAALFNLLGGRQKADSMLKQFLSQPNGFGMYAQLTNEFGFGEQYALDYAGDPAGTQQIVNNIRNTMYQPGPSLDNNDDLGANSSTFIWEMLGMYPENSGTGNLVFNSPGFPHAEIDLPNGNTVTIDAPNASPTTFYVEAARPERRTLRQAVRPVLEAGQGCDARLDPRPEADELGHRSRGGPAVLRARHRARRRVTSTSPRSMWHPGAPRGHVGRAERHRHRAARVRVRVRAARADRQPAESDHPPGQVGARHGHPRRLGRPIGEADVLHGAGQAARRRRPEAARPHSARAGRPAGQPPARLRQPGRLRRLECQRRELRRRWLELLGAGACRARRAAQRHGHGRRHQLHVAAVATRSAGQRDRRGPAGHGERTGRHATARVPRFGDGRPEPGADDADVLRRQYGPLLARPVRLDAERGQQLALVRQCRRGIDDLPQLRRLQQRP